MEFHNPGKTARLLSSGAFPLRAGYLQLHVRAHALPFYMNGDPTTNRKRQSTVKSS